MRRGVLPVSLPSKARRRSPSLTTYYHASNGFADDTALVEAAHAIKGMSSRPMAGGACRRLSRDNQGDRTLRRRRLPQARNPPKTTPGHDRNE